jgi:hypothetical protein
MKEPCISKFGIEGWDGCFLRARVPLAVSLATGIEIRVYGEDAETITAQAFCHRSLYLPAND